MKFEIEIRGKGSPNTAYVTVTTIGTRSTLEVAFQREPTPEALEAVSAKIDAYMKEQYGPSANLLKRVQIDSPEQLRKLKRETFGGGQG